MEKEQLHNAFNESSSDIGNKMVAGVSGVLNFFAACFDIPTTPNKTAAYRR